MSTHEFRSSLSSLKPIDVQPFHHTQTPHSQIIHPPQTIAQQRQGIYSHQDQLTQQAFYQQQPPQLNQSQLTHQFISSSLPSKTSTLLPPSHHQSFPQISQQYQYPPSDSSFQQQQQQLQQQQQQLQQQQQQQFAPPTQNNSLSLTNYSQPPLSHPLGTSQHQSYMIKTAQHLPPLPNSLSLLSPPQVNSTSTPHVPLLPPIKQQQLQQQHRWPPPQSTIKPFNHAQPNPPPPSSSSFLHITPSNNLTIHYNTISRQSSIAPPSRSSQQPLSMTSLSHPHQHHQQHHQQPPLPHHSYQSHPTHPPTTINIHGLSLSGQLPISLTHQPTTLQQNKQRIQQPHNTSLSQHRPAFQQPPHPARTQQHHQHHQHQQHHQQHQQPIFPPHRPFISFQHLNNSDSSSLLPQFQPTLVQPPTALISILPFPSTRRHGLSGTDLMNDDPNVRKEQDKISSATLHHNSQGFFVTHPFTHPFNPDADSSPLAYPELPPQVDTVELLQSLPHNHDDIENLSQSLLSRQRDHNSLSPRSTFILYALEHRQQHTMLENETLSLVKRSIPIDKSGTDLLHPNGSTSQTISNGTSTCHTDQVTMEFTHPALGDEYSIGCRQTNELHGLEKMSSHCNSITSSLCSTQSQLPSIDSPATHHQQYDQMNIQMESQHTQQHIGQQEQQQSQQQPQQQPQQQYYATDCPTQSHNKPTEPQQPQSQLSDPPPTASQTYQLSHQHLPPFHYLPSIQPVSDLKTNQNLDNEVVNAFLGLYPDALNKKQIGGLYNHWVLVSPNFHDPSHSYNTITQSLYPTCVEQGPGQNEQNMDMLLETAISMPSDTHDMPPLQNPVLHDPQSPLFEQDTTLSKFSTRSTKTISPSCTSTLSNQRHPLLLSAIIASEIAYYNTINTIIKNKSRLHRVHFDLSSPIKIAPSPISSLFPSSLSSHQSIRSSLTLVQYIAALFRSKVLPFKPIIITPFLHNTSHVTATISPKISINSTEMSCGQPQLQLQLQPVSSRPSLFITSTPSSTALFTSSQQNQLHPPTMEMITTTATTAPSTTRPPQPFHTNSTPIKIDLLSLPPPEIADNFFNSSGNDVISHKPHDSCDISPREYHLLKELQPNQQLIGPPISIPPVQSTESTIELQKLPTSSSTGSHTLSSDLDPVLLMMHQNEFPTTIGTQLTSHYPYSIPSSSKTTTTTTTTTIAPSTTHFLHTHAQALSEHTLDTPMHDHDHDHDQTLSDLPRTNFTFQHHHHHQHQQQQNSALNLDISNRAPFPSITSHNHNTSIPSSFNGLLSYMETSLNQPSQSHQSKAKQINHSLLCNKNDVINAVHLIDLYTIDALSQIQTKGKK